MKCPGCGADLTNDTVKCPFCKEVLNAGEENSGFDKCDFKYTITSKNDMDLLRKTMSESFKKPKFSKKFKWKVKRVLSKKKKIRRKRFKRYRRPANYKVSNISPQNKMYIAFYGGIIVIALLIAGIVFTVSAISNRERELTPVVYTKDNSLFLNCKRKPTLLTENAIDINSITIADGEEGLASIIDSEKIVKNSENGMYTYYFENYDVNANSGSLIRIFNGKKKAVISTGVHNSYILSPDGKKVLYLQSANENGDMGNLCYWEEGLEEAIKIAVDIDKDTFMFSDDGKYALYIRNYNYTEKGGDLCSFDLVNTESESVVLDSGVKKVFGTDKKEKNIYYSKAVENSDKVYDIFVKTHTSDSVKIFEKAVKTPIMSEDAKKMLIYAYNDEKLCSLFELNLGNYKKEKLATQMTTVIKATDNFDRILYNKVYDNGTIDCYVYTKGEKTVKVAENIKQVSAEFENANQFSVSDDLTKTVYISDFDNARAGGKLYVSTLKPGEAETVHIADDAYTCRISPDGKSVVYGKDYSKAREVFDLYIHKKEESTLVKEEIEKSFFAITNDRKNIVFINEFDTDGFSGTLNIMNQDGVVLNTVGDAGAFSCTGECGVIIFNNYNEEDGSWTVSFAEKKSLKEIDTGADGLVRF